jgi:adenylate cyclase
LTDVFALQDEVTVAIVSAIQPILPQTEIAMATRRRPENLTAYDFFLRGMQQYYWSTTEGFAETMGLAHRVTITRKDALFAGNHGGGRTWATCHAARPRR